MAGPQKPTYYDHNSKPVFGRTIKCQRCMGHGTYIPQLSRHRVECNPCKGSGYVNRTQEGPSRD
jgi:DnaJ-class molecular chaperone